jgi:hypothetical protein
LNLPLRSGRKKIGKLIFALTETARAAKIARVAQQVLLRIDL